MAKQDWSPRRSPFLPYRTKVKTTKAVRFRDLHIPRGKVGEIVRMMEGGAAARIKFDDDRYGTFDLWANEFKRV